MHYKDWINHLPAYKPARLLTGKATEMVKLSSNENALGPSLRAIEALQNAAETIYRYPDAQAGALRRALAERAGLPPEAVLCGNGSDELVFLICVGFLREGDEVVMAQGTFISYLLRSQAMGAHPVPVPLREYTHDLPAMAEAVTPATRLLFVCNPNNPTGTTNGASEMHDLLAHVSDEVLVVVDEAYIEFATRPDYPDLLSEVRRGRPNLVLLRTFAKIYGLAGLRLGYAYGHPDVIDYLNRVRPVFNVNALAQVAGLAALDDVDHVARSRAHADASRAFFERALTTLGLPYVPGEANFIAVEVGDDAAVTEGLYQRGVMVTPLSGWGVPGAIRISFGLPDQNERCIAALTEVLASLEGNARQP
ncbi:MAG: histidinol-phosphate transaminase [Chloroflexaceae bacterium]|nr:histidinol-phosphate transaminase [Chloroflexaceae bacterium]